MHVCTISVSLVIMLILFLYALLNVHVQCHECIYNNVAVRYYIIASCFRLPYAVITFLSLIMKSLQ